MQRENGLLELDIRCGSLCMNGMDSVTKIEVVISGNKHLLVMVQFFTFWFSKAKVTASPVG